MLTPADLYRQIDAQIDRSELRLRAFVESLEKVPELGFLEVATASLLARQFVLASLHPRTGIAQTAVVADLAGAATGPTIAVLGELDALPVDANDAGSQASHTCGHHLQLAIVAGVAAAVEPLASALSGRVRFIGVPAEEFVDLATRFGLKSDGKVTYLSGKAELVRLGYFDDVDIAILVHSTTRSEEGDFAIGGSTNAMTAKWVQYQGIPAHAGAAPERGVNALAAAVIGLDAINAIRDTFREEDRVRVHGIMTRGGSAVNVVPADARLEIFVRAASREAVQDVETRVDRALWAGALAVGASVRVRTVPGYLPLRQDRQLAQVARDAARQVMPLAKLRRGVDRAGSTDMGDLSHLMPALQPWAGGVSGDLHSSTFRMTDFDVAVLRPARIVARMVVDLLRDGAGRATEILRTSKPLMTRHAYLDYLRTSYRTEVFDGAAPRAGSLEVDA